MGLDPPRVYVHDHNFQRVCQLGTAAGVAREYQLMAVTQAHFSVARSEPRLEDLDRAGGAVIVIESTGYPYPWVGVLAQIRWQPHADAVHVTARSLDALLGERTLPADFEVTGTAGVIARRILDVTNGINDTGIVPGSNIAVGPAQDRTITDRRPLDALNGLARDAGYEWWIEYQVSAAGVLATLQFAPARGYDRCRDTAYRSPGLLDWSEAMKDYTATFYAQTIVGGAPSVLTAYTSRDRSRALSDAATKGIGDVLAAPATVHGHGIERSALPHSPLTRRERLGFSEALKDQGALQAASAASLMRPPAAERSMRLAVGTDDNRATLWHPLEVGNIVSVHLRDAYWDGYDGPVRIVSAQPQEANGFIALVAEVVGPHA